MLSRAAIVGLESNGRAAVVTTKLTLSFDEASDDDDASDKEFTDRRLLDLLPVVPFDSPMGIRSSSTSEGRLRAFFSKKAKRFHLDDAIADCLLAIANSNVSSCFPVDYCKIIMSSEFRIQKTVEE